MNASTLRAALIAFAVGAGPHAFAAVGANEPGPIEFTGSGFLSVVAGKVLKGNHDAATDLGYACPCFISDYAQNGVYEHGAWRLSPDSRLGLQGTASAQGGRYSVTAQAVARGSKGGAVDLEWLYGTAELNSDWTLQVGRKRLPLFLSSEVQDVGLALPWTHLPPQLYGWDVVNFNGASLSYRHSVGDWLANAQVLYGNETARDAGYWQIYNGKGTRTDSRWSNIVGAEVKMSYDWFDVRAVLVQSTTSNRQVSAGETNFSAPAHQRIHGLSFNADDGRWVGRAEFLYIDRREDYGYDHAQLYAAGYRFGSMLALLSYSNYRQTTNPDAGPAEGHSTHSAVLRYELGRSSAVKLQYDIWRDKTAPGYSTMHGDVHLVTIGFDKVF